MKFYQALIYLFFSFSITQSQNNKGGFLSQSQIDVEVKALRSNFTNPKYDSLIIGDTEKLTNPKNIIIFGGFHGSLAAAAEVLGLAKLYCEDITKKNFQGLYKNFNIEFVPIINSHFYGLVYENKTEDNTELQYRGSTCGSSVEIDPDRNFEYEFKSICKEDVYTGNNNYDSEYAKSFYTKYIGKNKTIIIINIQGFGSKKLIGYASKETKLSKADKYTYDNLIQAEYTSIGSDSTNRKTGQMVDTAMNKSVYAVIYNTKARVTIDMKKLTSIYTTEYQDIFDGLNSALKTPLIDLRKAKENHKASEDSPSEIPFKLCVTNFYPFTIQGKLLMDLKISQKSSTLELEYKKTTATKMPKYSTSKSDFDDYEDLIDADEFDTKYGFYPIVFDKINFPAQTEVCFNIVFERSVSGSMAYSADISLESLDGQFSDVSVVSEEQYVDTTNKSETKSKGGVILLMFLVFVLIIATIVCLLISKKNKYNRFFH